MPSLVDWVGLDLGSVDGESRSWRSSSLTLLMQILKRFGFYGLAEFKREGALWDLALNVASKGIVGGGA